MVRLPPAAAQAWEARPSVELSAGHESDILLDPDLTRTTVPGGAFLDLSPALELVRGWGGRSSVRLQGQGSFERFANDARRELRAASLSSEVRLRTGDRARVRLGGSGAWFDDSERAAVQRLDAGGEVAGGLVMRTWLAEAVVAVRGRRYPDLDVTDAAGAVAPYTESTVSGGMAVVVDVAGRAFLRAEASRLWTHARDPLFDAASGLVRAMAQVELSRHWRARGVAVFQHRDFDLASAGDDDYLQLGVAVDALLRPGLVFSARWSGARYSSPAGVEDDTHRVELGCTVRWGAGQGRAPAAAWGAAGEARETPMAGPRDLEDSSATPHAGQPIAFRVHAPGARNVALVGDFNGWSEPGEPLQPHGDGWWELRRSLPAGSWQYAFVVDGRWVPPPQAEATVDDGFGGRNGILVVLP